MSYHAFVKSVKVETEARLHVFSWGCQAKEILPDIPHFRGGSSDSRHLLSVLCSCSQWVRACRTMPPAATMAFLM